MNINQTGGGSAGESEENMIYTVFPKNYPKEYESSYLPQDFENYKEAKEYGDCLDCDYEIEITSGECL